MSQQEVICQNPFHHPLGTSPLRDFSLSNLADGYFGHKAKGQSNTSEDPCSLVQLEIRQKSSGTDNLQDLPHLVELANLGMKCGMKPVLADGGMGGTYFLRDENSNIVLVCKPGDEEHNSPHNPHQVINHPSGYGSWYKGHILPGFGMFREVAAYALDNGFAGVPPTHLARVRDYFVTDCRDSMSSQPAASSDYKVCSVQSYVRHDCCAEDMGPGRFNFEDVQRIAVFDMRVCNLDRHEGNLLVCGAHPYQQADSQKSAPPAESMIFGGFDDKDALDASSGGALRLVPIDHGYVLPHVLFLGDPSLSWLTWPQTSAPLAPSVREYIRALDFDRDAETLRRAVGEAVPDSSLLTLRVCTSFLKKGEAAGLTLSEMARGMCVDEDERPRPGEGPPAVSLLQRAVYVAVRMAAENLPAEDAAAAADSSSGLDDSVLVKRAHVAGDSPARPVSRQSRFADRGMFSSASDLQALRRPAPGARISRQVSAGGSFASGSPVSVLSVWNDPSMSPRFKREGLVFPALSMLLTRQLAVPLSESSAVASEQDLRRAMTPEGMPLLLRSIDLVLDRLVAELVVRAQRQ